MSVQRIGDTVFGMSSGALFMSTSVKNAYSESPMAQAAKDPIPGNDLASSGVALWGTDNLQPNRMWNEIEQTGVLSSGIQAKVRIGMGKGPTPMRLVSIDKSGYEELEPVLDEEILDFLEMTNAFNHAYASGMDLMGVGEAYTQFILSRDRKKIVALKREDAARCRVSKMSNTGKIENVFISADWAQWSNPESAGPDRRIITLPLLDNDFPHLDLQTRNKDFAFIMRMQYPLFGRNYYSLPPWWAALRWVKIAQGIPAMKEAMFNNQMTVKYLVEVNDKYWERHDPNWKSYSGDKMVEKQDEFYTDIDSYLVGGKNAYKSIFSPRWMDSEGKPVSGITITPIDDKVKDGKLLPDSAAANSEILFALMINPALMGVSMPGGSQVSAGSGSNIREAFLVQVMMQEVERRIIGRVYDTVKRYNGWDKSIVFRWPNQILTTLNTGANTQPTA